MNAQVYRSPARDLGALERRYAASRTVRPTRLFLTVFGVPGLGLLTAFQSGEGQVFAGDRTTNACLGVALLGSDAVAWTDLGAVEVKAGHVLVRSTAGAGLDVEWARVDDARLFLEVVRERTKLPNRGSTSSS